jgi:uncharacterized protein (DUF342 family)
MEGESEIFNLNQFIKMMKERKEKCEDEVEQLNDELYSLSEIEKQKIEKEKFKERKC